MHIAFAEAVTLMFGVFLLPCPLPPLPNKYNHCSMWMWHRSTVMCVAIHTFPMLCWCVTEALLWDKNNLRVFLLFLTGIVRASSVFPILSTILLLLGGLCIGAGRIYSSKNNIVLSAGILFVAAGMLFLM